MYSLINVVYRFEKEVLTFNGANCIIFGPTFIWSIPFSCSAVRTLFLVQSNGSRTELNLFRAGKRDHVRTMLHRHC